MSASQGNANASASPMNKADIRIEYLLKNFFLLIHPSWIQTVFPNGVNIGLRRDDAGTIWHTIYMPNYTLFTQFSRLLEDDLYSFNGRCRYYPPRILFKIIFNSNIAWFVSFRG